MYRAALSDYERGEAGLAYVAGAQQGLGNVLIDLGRLDEASAMLTTAEASWQKSAGGADPATLAFVHAWQGRAALASGRYPEAEQLLSAALAQLQASRDHKDLQVRRTLRALVEVHTRMGQPARAEEFRMSLAASEAQIAQLASADCESETASR